MDIKEVNINNKIYRKYKECYWISQGGDVSNISFDENNDIDSFKILKQQVSNTGYCRVELRLNKNKKKVSIHRAVYEVWVGELMEGLIIEHLDGNKKNNHYSNLKQSTQKENIQTAFTHGTFHQAFHNKTNLIAYDKVLNTTNEYESVRDFLIGIGAPEYMIKHGALSGLDKRKEFKDRFIIEKIGHKGRSSQTNESIV